VADYKLPVITGTSLTIGDLLRWDGSNWVNYADSVYLTGITGESIGDLSDVDLTDIADGKILKYNSGTSKWECEDETGAGTGTSGLQIGALAATGAATPTQRMAASRFKAYSSGTITSLGVFPYLVTATKHIVLGIYSDNSNYPGSLLGQTDAYAFVATDLRTPIHLALQSPVSLTANTQYWIAFMCEDTKPNLYAVIPALNAGGQYKAIDYSDTFPDPFPAGGGNDYLWSVWGM